MAISFINSLIKSTSDLGKKLRVTEEVLPSISLFNSFSPQLPFVVFHLGYKYLCVVHLLGEISPHASCQFFNIIPYKFLAILPNNWLYHMHPFRPIVLAVSLSKVYIQRQFLSCSHWEDLHRLSFRDTPKKASSAACENCLNIEDL